MKRRKTIPNTPLGESNDDIPYDELSLAHLLQSARARKLGWCRGDYYEDASGNLCKPKHAVKCCAQGAYDLDKGDGVSLRPSCDANDDPSYDGPCFVTSDDGDELLSCIQLGHAFRSAMTEGGRWL